VLKEAKTQGNPVALMIRELRLDSNAMVVSLSPGMAHLQASQEDMRTCPEKRPVAVELELSMSGHLNAAEYYKGKKAFKVKAVKTAAQTEKAVKAAEQKTVKLLKEVDAKHEIRKMRKTHWFEKFHWFVSSENFLVIAGRDAQQNEQVVKRYLQANDLYIHAEIHGASSVVVKNPGGGAVPPVTLSQAGIFCLCFSSAWKNKTTARAYWVHADQVSKTAPTGARQRARAMGVMKRPGYEGYEEAGL
jgi:predicted ribosome quality control (RQC) complex YloA/Tae2 family protein